MKISRTAAFATLASIRSRETAAALNYCVRPLTKAGAVSKFALSSIDRFATLEEAEKAARYRESLNPGKTFVVCPL